MLKQYPAALLKQKALSRTSSGLVVIARHTTRKRGRDPGGQIVAKLYATCAALIPSVIVVMRLLTTKTSKAPCGTTSIPMDRPLLGRGGVAKSIVLHNRATTRV
jgi:hypothetical protein